MKLMFPHPFSKYKTKDRTEWSWGIPYNLKFWYRLLSANFMIHSNLIQLQPASGFSNLNIIQPILNWYEMAFKHSVWGATEDLFIDFK